ncbi:tRNA (adenosine(37)-N6)-dimethylallyltransferase MiaA [Periweissella fabalis]|uniref:tRNA dimethylallyltransferase n=1 Tax=Periweissella fabalis TaxID=1070421 RepID=A0A7X6S3V1_9LACO|nr:tRNA (adenosine(37)-N6)-dimethylallyltransferase MiaA [Periweissella fabalis]MCM0598780.1 tRNA (adenosine(37)-N6)-dimethylallyltransferase MiaA [Periweissella fabalis]NKZ24621.1 tRNA (adenosine(37)-N6)-dimethylallyltransferase MiaA [Periweissella fabalis]
MKKIIVIVGPTAVGKTALSIQMAQTLNGEIISGDSMQVYQTLDIGTAKATCTEQAGIKHYLLDTKRVDETFTVAEWVDEARKAIDEIYSHGKVPIIVGGTGFYIAALLGDMPLGGNEAGADETIRTKWEAFSKQYGSEALWQELNKVDSKAAEKISPNNTRRIIRALEVFELTGIPFSKQPRTLGKREYDAYIIGLTTQRDILYQRINQRVDEMISVGLEKEAYQLFEQGGQNLQSGTGIGYKEWYPYFEHKSDLTSTIELIKRNSRRFAKRQLTWFRHQIEGIQWFDLVANRDEITVILNRSELFLQYESKN